jgi:hypothetical protein
VTNTKQPVALCCVCFAALRLPQSCKCAGCGGAGDNLATAAAALDRTAS